MKKIFQTISVFAILCFAGAGAVSCVKFLDVSEEVSASIDIEKVFSNPLDARRWHSNLFSRVPNYSAVEGSDNAAFGNPWNSIAGEAIGRVNSGYMVRGFNASNAQHHRWTGVYQSIRDILIFRGNVRPVGQAGDKNPLTEMEVKRMLAESKFLEAFYYFLLFEQYGPVPIVDKLYSPDDRSFNFIRASVDEIIGHIDGLLEEVLESADLPPSAIINPATNDQSQRYSLDQIMRPTVTTVLALRAKLWVYAASPLFNGGYTEAVALTGPEGKHLFPERDDSKWVTAKGHLEALLTDVAAKGHKIYTVSDGGSGVDAHRSVYELFQNYTDEILWATPVNTYGDFQERNTDPRDVYAGWAAVGVTQNSVDLFFCNDGLPVTESPLYSEDKLVSVMNPCNESKRIDNNVFSMYANREPRFYAAVAYQGKSWHIQPHDKPNYTNGFAKGGGSDNSHGDQPYGGYLLYKFKNRRVLNTSVSIPNKITRWGRPTMIFRLADFYLYYAEVCNEINPADPNIITYLDAVRIRAGIPGYRELADNAVKNIIGDQDKQRKAIQQERHNELFAEGQRYFDIRRWMICGEGQDAQQYTVYSMDMSGEANKPIGSFGSFYRRIVLENRSWTRAMYLYPIPFNEMQKSSSLIQNPLWD